MNRRIERVRTAERKYHEACYENCRLFESGSWLHKPVKTVMELWSLFDSKDHVTVLDLGCGVGRNSIPIAETLKSRRGKVVCVDLLETALGKLAEYGEQYEVSPYLEMCLADIGDFVIAPDTFDYIVAVSSLEHVRSFADFSGTLAAMARGTKAHGVNCIVMNTNVRETDARTGAELEPLIELRMTTRQALRHMEHAYAGWEVLLSTVKPLKFDIERDGRPVILQGDVLTHAVRKI